MKKFAISSAVVGSFALYTLFVKHQEVESQNAISLATNNLPTISPTETASPTLKPSVDGTHIPTAVPTQIPTPKPQGQYKDGSFTGNAADAFYGNIQVKVVISGGKISDIIFLQYPNDRNTSVEINSQAMPYLRQEAIQVQNANVNIVTGATDSSQAFRESLASALSQAH